MSKDCSRAYRVAALWLCLLTIWTQLLAPAAALAVAQPPDGFSVICSHTLADRQPSDQVPSDHGDAGQHQCCPLCHIQVADLLGDWQPDFTRFDYPLRSPWRWRPSLALHQSTAEERPGRPRGPPLV